MKETQGVIYIFTNPSFPKYVKIGYTRDLYRRLKELNRSEAVPYAFRAYAKYEVKEDLLDTDLHNLIDQLNKDLRAQEKFAGKTRSKEFYEMSAEDAYRMLERIARISGTQHRLKRMKETGDEELEQKIEDEIQKDQRRGPFSFKDVGIGPGSEIAYVADPSIVATVAGERRISYQGKETSLSALAAHLTGRVSVAGPLFFTYQGKVLAEIRNEMESAQSAGKTKKSGGSKRRLIVKTPDEAVGMKTMPAPRRGPFRFNVCGIKPGSEIAYAHDPGIKATVVDDRSIRYQDKLTSLSALASQLSGRASVAGPLFFTYKGKVLAEIRREKEENQ